MSDPQTRPSTVEVAETAARAVREMNHRTHGPDAFTGPAQLYRLVGELVMLVDGLPQLLNQLGRWLHPNTTQIASGPTTTPTPARPSPTQPPT